MTRSKNQSGRVTVAPAQREEVAYVRPKRRLRAVVVLFMVALLVLSLAGGVIALIVGS